MATEKRIPRVRIHENNFDKEIKNIAYPRDCLVNGKPEEYFIEVVDEKNEVIALFFHIKPFRKSYFWDLMDYAKYYDLIGLDQMEEEDWIAFRDSNNLGSDLTMKEMRDAKEDEYYEHWDIGITTHVGCPRGLISYGRLKYPYGLVEHNRREYFDQGYMNLLTSNTYEDLVEGNVEFLDDLVDILNFVLSLNNVQTNSKKLERILSDNYQIDYFISSGIEIISGIADNLFTVDNIDEFIDEANNQEEIEILAFLLDYKNKHFPADG
jgi:hypothetical protein